MCYGHALLFVKKHFVVKDSKLRATMHWQLYILTMIFTVFMGCFFRGMVVRLSTSCMRWLCSWDTIYIVHVRGIWELWGLTAFCHRHVLILGHCVHWLLSVRSIMVTQVCNCVHMLLDLRSIMVTQGCNCVHMLLDLRSIMVTQGCKLSSLATI